MPARVIMRFAASAVALVIAAAGSVVAGGAAAGAESGAGPGWRIVATVGSASQGELPGSQVITTGAASAFVYWRCDSCAVATRNRNFIQHWNGRRWVHIALPVRLNYPRFLIAVGASSGSDLWAITSFGGLYIWHGSSWAKRSIPSWALGRERSGDLAAQLSVLAPDNAWVFSQPTLAAHYFHGAWHKVSLPATPGDVTTLAPDDIWSAGITSKSLPTAKPVWTAAHWDGSAWHTLAFPAVRLSAGESTSYQITATGPHNLWAVRLIDKSRGTAGIALLHWTGTWRTIKVPGGVTDLTDLASDGNGGLWMAGFHGSGSAQAMSFYHYGSGGWSRHAIPVKPGAHNILWSLTSIPGTRSLWAPGLLQEHGGDIQIGDLMKYGP